MGHLWSGMFSATLEGVLYKTVSVQLSSRHYNEIKEGRLQALHIFDASWFSVLCFVKWSNLDT